MTPVCSIPTKEALERSIKEDSSVILIVEDESTYVISGYPGEIAPSDRNAGQKMFTLMRSNVTTKLPKPVQGWIFARVYFEEGTEQGNIEFFT